MFAAAALLLLTGGNSQAQSIKLVSLSLPADVVAGSWVSYQVTVVFKNRSPRRFTQRLAVVSREGTGAEAGAWVELRTMEGGKTRTERGFFMPPESGKLFAVPSFGADAPVPDASEMPAPGGAPAGAPAGASRLRLARYQRLTADGKLYEYSLDEEGAPAADEDVSAMDLFEFQGKLQADTLAPDTLRVGRTIVPCRVQRIRRFGVQDWEGDDSTYVNHAVMTRTVWMNAWVPVTGYARSVIEVATERVPTRASEAPPDSAAPAGAAAPAIGAGASGQTYFYRAEVNLMALGNDAVPEITQAPEPAPQESAPRPKAVIK